MKAVLAVLYGLAACGMLTLIGAFMGAVAGVGVAGLLVQPEEARVLYIGVGYGVPVGALAGLAMGLVIALRYNVAATPPR